MMSIKLITIKNIQITFQYLSQFVTLNSESYKTLKELKIKAINKMLGVPEYVYCSYLGVNLTKDENKKIGDIFNHKEKVLIKLKIPKVDSPLNYNMISKNGEYQGMNDLNDLKSPKSNFDNNFKTFFSNKTNLTTNKNSFSPKYDSAHLNLKKKPRKIKIIDKIPIVKKFINILSSNRGKSQKENPFLYNIKKDNSLPLIQISPDHAHNNKFKKIEKLCNCKRYPISEYCRNCGKFICNGCRISDKHKGHIFIHLDMFNLKQNIISYATLLQNDIMGTLDLNKNIRYNSVDDNINYKYKNEEINEKYEKAIEKYFQVINLINNYISKQDKERTKLQIEAYNKSSLKIQKEINDLMIKFKNNKNKEINLNYLEYYFREINSREEMLLFLQKDILKYHISNEINIKMKSSLNKIDKILKEINNNKNPFNLGEKYRNEFANMKIIKSDIEAEQEKQKEIEEELKKKNELNNKEKLIRRNSIFRDKNGSISSQNPENNN